MSTEDITDLSRDTYRRTREELEDFKGLEGYQLKKTLENTIFMLQTWHNTMIDSSYDKPEDGE